MPIFDLSQPAKSTDLLLHFVDRFDLFNQAMVSLARADADQSEREYQQLQDANATRRVSAHIGL